MAVRKKFNALGRGLDVLISTEDVRPAGSSTINEVELGLIDANPNQPRREFDEETLNELAASISEIGIIQPITLREMEDGRYQIIAGERRWRASQLVGLRTIPAYIRTANDENVMEMALIENIQRQDLNAVEIALAYQHLIDQHGLTQEQVSDKVGKKRTTVANYLRLLKLPAPVQVALQNHEIDNGHARALLALENPKEQVKLFKEILQNGYSVRKVEEIIKTKNEGGAVAAPGRKEKAGIGALGAEEENLRAQMERKLGTGVKMTCKSKGCGKVTFEFKDLDELRRIVALL